MTPQQYAEKYGLAPEKVSEEIAIDLGSYFRYNSRGKRRRTPSPQILTICQLLDFIRQNGLEPPTPTIPDRRTLTL